jgi:hypothetical protein
MVDSTRVTPNTAACHTTNGNFTNISIFNSSLSQASITYDPNACSDLDLNFQHLMSLWLLTSINLPIQWYWIRIENLAVAQLVNNSPAPYGTLSFGLCSQKSAIEFNPETVKSSLHPHSSLLSSVSTGPVYTHLLLDLPSGLCPSHFAPQPCIHPASHVPDHFTTPTHPSFDHTNNIWWRA